MKKSNSLFKYGLLIYGILLMSMMQGCLDADTSSKTIPSKTSNSRSTTVSFELLTPAQTGVKFINKSIETNTFNYLFWSHIYTGSGVAVADFNMDGLLDFIVVGNVMPAKIYLNKGKMKFEDVTEQSGIKPDGKWASGVAIGDVNGDGLPDIYISKNSMKPDPNARENTLYLNKGDMEFEDITSEAKVGDRGYSTQATFFDYDRDGDLDLFVGNQPPNKRLVKQKAFANQLGVEYTSDHLYENDGSGHFIDVTKKAGLENWGYTLNVLATDINRDGWSDLYISNDYAEKDFIYINNGDGTFKESLENYVKHISNSSMGSDVGDINNDGLQDIGVLDMAASDHYRSKTNMRAMNTKAFWQNVEKGNYYQFMVNTLQLNTGVGKYQEIASYAHIAHTDWSWSLLMADFDNDGWKDIFVTNGSYRDVRNNDFDKFGKFLNSKGINTFEPLKLIKQIPQTPIPNRFYWNQHNYEFKEIAKEVGLGKPGFSIGAAYADFDNDGDLDIIINNLGDTMSIYRNTTPKENHYLDIKLIGKEKNKSAIGARIEIFYDGAQQVHEQILTRGYFSCSTPIVHFGLGSHTGIERIKIRWPDATVSVIQNVKADQQLTIDQNSTPSKPFVIEETPKGYVEDVSKRSGVDFVHRENTYNDFEREVLLPHKESQNGPKIAKGDVNKDGLEDFYIGGASGYSGKLYLQQPGLSFKLASSQPWSKDNKQEDMGSVFFDADGDGDLDLYVVSGGSEFHFGDPLYQDRLYINNGKGQFHKASPSILPSIDQSGSVVLAEDMDGDGDLDLFVGGRLIPDKYPYPAKSYYLQNNQGQFVDKTEELAEDFIQLGMVTDAVFVDMNGDGQKDLVAVGEWMPVSVLINEKGHFVNKTADYGWEDTRNWWWSIASEDINSDGRPDLVLGGMGKNHKYKASPEKPFEIFGEDFDGDGINDVVLAKHYHDKLVPVRGKDCSTEEMPFIRDKFPTYDSFAKASIYDILPGDKVKQALHYAITDFSSKIALSTGKTGSAYEMVELPSECQFSPIQGLQFINLDMDPQLELIGCGNLYPAEVETVRHDAGIGFVLDIKEGGKKLDWLSPRKTGFIADKDARSIQVLNDKWIVVGNNSGPVQVYLRNDKER